MNKLISMAAIGTILLSVTTSYAKSGKEQFCPLLSQIGYNNHRLFAYNSEHKSFSSGPPCMTCDEDQFLLPISFQAELTKYDETEKTLACVYNVEVYDYRGGRIIKTELKSLINRGDY